MESKEEAMARMTGQKMKLLYLKDIFEKKTDEQHSMTLEEIIEELDKMGVHAERKSLYGDIELLREYGMDIIGRRSKQYEYYLGRRSFELPELKLLADAVAASKFITKTKSRALIRKIENLAGEYDASLLHRQVYAEHRTKAENETIYYNIDAIYNAIDARVKIHFKYFDWNRCKRREYRHGGKIYSISPWAMAWDSENYYMVGYDSEEGIIKHFRVDKMDRIAVTAEEREGKGAFEDFDMGQYSKKLFGMFGGAEESVTLRCENSMANVIIDRFGKDIPFFDYDEAHFCVCVNIVVSPVFLSWVIGFGERIHIVSPKGAVSMCRQMAREVLDSYE